MDDKVDHGDIAAIDGSAVLTVSIWVFVDTLVDSDEFWSKWTANVGIALRLAGATGAIRAFFDNQANYATSGDILTTAVWTHLGLVYDGGLANADRFKLYFNGAASALTVTGTLNTTIPATTASFNTMGGGPGGFLDGRMAFLKVWTAALGPQEILAEIHNWRARRTQNLLIGAPYDDLTAAEDFSGNRNHGTVTGALQVPGPPVPYGAPD